MENELLDAMQDATDTMALWMLRYGMDGAKSAARCIITLKRDSYERLGFSFLLDEAEAYLTAFGY